MKFQIIDSINKSDVITISANPGTVCSSVNVTVGGGPFTLYYKPNGAANYTAYTSGQTVSLSAGSLYVTAPTGYTGTFRINGGMTSDKNCEAVHAVQNNWAGQEIAYLTTQDVLYSGISIPFAAKYGKISIHKSSSDPNATTGNSCYSLAGAVYGVWDSRANAEAGGATGKYGEMTTDANGNASLANLPYGQTYYVKEKST